MSVADKTGIVELARGLVALGVELVSTGGTARELGAAGLPVREVADLTGFPEMLDGRVKTLHPAVHGGLLARRDRSDHLDTLERHGIGPIDLLAANLYPFERTVARPDATVEEAIEQIDIGGPAMIRSAAKNHDGVAVVVDPAQYGPVLDELRASGRRLSPTTRRRLALEAFRRTAQYDAAIATWLRGIGSDGLPAGPSGLSEPGRPGDRERLVRFPPRVSLDAERVTALRYGENPHQAAAFYRVVSPAEAPWGVGAVRQLHGPELSYNNLLDLSGALGLLLEFEEPAAVAIKHTNPCGVATALDVVTADAGPSRRWRDEPGEHAHGGGLAGGVGSEEAEHLTRAHLEAHILHGGQRAIVFGQVFGLDHESPVAFKARDFDRGVAQNSTNREVIM